MLTSLDDLTKDLETKIATILIYSEKFHEYCVCVLDVLTVDAYQNIAEIADRQANVQIVVGNSIAAGIVLINLPFLLADSKV